DCESLRAVLLGANAADASVGIKQERYRRQASLRIGMPPAYGNYNVVAQAPVQELPFCSSRRETPWGVHPERDRCCPGDSGRHVYRRLYRLQLADYLRG